ncbi:MAG: GNAT family N-acetyltransferase [Propionibacteriales bacterium]|nr:GNAT family N-acetyltransferase [Propionibacteriales bacterium]
MRSDLEVTDVDVSDEAAFAEFHRVLTVADAVGRAYSTPIGLDEMRVGFQPDNTHLLEVHIGVLPEHRRRGVGRALFDHALQTARATGRCRIYAQVIERSGRRLLARVSPRRAV